MISMFVVSTSFAAGGLPLGVVVTSGESSSIVDQAMCALKELLPKRAFYGQNSPENIITDNSSAERNGLKNAWPTATLYLCVFHFKACGDSLHPPKVAFIKPINST